MKSDNSSRVRRPTAKARPPVETAVASRRVVSVDLPPEPSSATRARQLAREHVAECPAAVIDTVALLVTELVTNAVVHGRGPISVRTVLDPVSLRVEVQDTASDLPHRIDADQARDGGRGLAIVDAFSREWGCTVVRGASGKSVWFTMERHEAPS